MVSYQSRICATGAPEVLNIPSMTASTLANFPYGTTVGQMRSWLGLDGSKQVPSEKAPSLLEIACDSSPSRKLSPPHQTSDHEDRQSVIAGFALKQESQQPPAAVAAASAFQAAQGAVMKPTEGRAASPAAATVAEGLGPAIGARQLSSSSTSLQPASAQPSLQAGISGAPKEAAPEPAPTGMLPPVPRPRRMAVASADLSDRVEKASKQGASTFQRYDLSRAEGESETAVYIRSGTESDYKDQAKLSKEGTIQ
eukprot:scaffold73299_cov17-Tisochrysis_lutea.AAC.1